MTDTRHSINAQAAQSYVVVPGELSYDNELEEHVKPELLARLCGLSNATAKSVRIGMMFLLWWAINIVYNVYNKRVLMEADLPWIFALGQLGIGVPICLIMWGTGLRKMPKLSRAEIWALCPIAACHLFTHLGAILSMGAGPVAFTHIVKASEPVVSALFAGLLLGVFFSWHVYVCLIPIIGGVAYASASADIGFTMLAFTTAMGSNVASALRAVIGKKVMGKDTYTEDQNMTPGNIFAVMVFISTLMLIPLALFLELDHIQVTLENVEAPMSQIAFEGTLACFSYFYYNEVAFLILDDVHPVTHAVGNTMKRVAVIISAIFIFNTPMDLNGYLGSTVAICGTLIYSIISKRYNVTYRCSCVRNVQ